MMDIEEGKFEVFLNNCLTSPAAPIVRKRYIYLIVAAAPPRRRGKKSFLAPPSRRGGCALQMNVTLP